MADTLRARGEFAASEAMGRRVLAALRASARGDSLRIASAFDVIVAAGIQGRPAPDAKDLATRAVGIRQRHQGPSHPDVARSLTNLAGLLYGAGDYEGAMPLFERALAIREKVLGPDHPDVAACLNNIGSVLRDTGDFAGAKPLFERALAIREKALGPDHPAVAQSLNNLASVLWATGDYPKSKELLERALKIREKTLGPDHPLVASSLNNLANLTGDMGDDAGALRLYERALAINEKTLGPDHPNVATALDNIATELWTMGDFAAAKPQYERALAVREKALGPQHPMVASSLANLANLLKSTDDYSAAKSLYERALAIQEKSLGSEHPDLASVLDNLADLLLEMGDYAGSRALFERALAIEEKALGPDHPSVASTVGNLASLFQDTGDYAAAKPLCERALAIREKALGPDHPDVALSLNNLAGVLWASGDAAGAKSRTERALAIWEKALGPDHPAVADGLGNLADLLRGSGDAAGASQLLGRALAIREKAFGPEHPVVAQTLVELARCRRAEGDARGALEAALHAETIGREHLRLMARALPEREALGYAAIRASGMDVALSMLDGLPDAESKTKIFDAEIRSRALVLDGMAVRNHTIAALQDSTVTQLERSLASASRRYANLLVRGPDPEHPERYRSVIDQARQEKERAEQALAGKSAAFGSAQAESRIGLDAVARALPPRSAMVAYVRYEREPLGRPLSTASERPSASVDVGVPSYVAFVLRAEAQSPEVVPLGSAAEIDSLVGRWRQTAVAGLESGVPVPRGIARLLESTCDAAGAAVRERIWDPLAHALSGTKRVFVVPDGSLNLLNLSALPAGELHYLVESGPLIHDLSAERDLVRSEKSVDGRGLLAVGGPAFDEAPSVEATAAAAVASADSRQTPAASADPSQFRSARSACGEFREVKFTGLPAAEKEVTEVAELWKRGGARSFSSDRAHRSKSSVTELTGAAATEAAFKESAPGCRVLHLATHAFFVGCPSALDRSASGAPSELGTPALAKPVRGDNPLLLSGIVLAGANRRADTGLDQDDGILTAEEIAALDLTGVEWAVLSACDTGVGELRAGEGVLGLRRAFQVAGARALIMSLWSVEDQSTREWMQRLYEARFVKHHSTAEAVRDASKGLLLERRKHGLSTHPFYWAAFVGAGDWR